MKNATNHSRKKQALRIAIFTAGILGILFLGADAVRGTLTLAANAVTSAGNLLLSAQTAIINVNNNTITDLAGISWHDGSTQNTAASTSSTFVVCASNARTTKRCDYAADGTNDYVEIQAALNALPASGGRVTLSEGTFSQTTQTLLSVPSNTTLEGQGWGTFLSLGSGAMYIQNSDTAGGNSNVIVRNFRIQKTGLTVKLKTVTNGLIEGLHITTLASADRTGEDAVNVEDSTFVQVRGNRITDFSDQAIEFWNCDYCDVVENIITHDSGDTAMDCVLFWDNGSNNSSDYVRVLGNDITGCGQDGVEASGGAAYWVVSNNTIHDMLQSGIDIYDGSDYGIISNNVIYNTAQTTEAGITISPDSDRIQVMGNLVYSNGAGGTRPGITAQGTQITIIGNTSRSNTGTGIIGGSNSSIIGNEVTSNGAGISGANGARQGVISGNNVYYNTGHGISLAAGNGNDNWVVTGNVLRENGQGGTGYGLNLDATSPEYTDYTYTTSNQFVGNITGSVSIGSRARYSQFRANYGFITENKGSSNIANGTTSKIITHGLALTPSAGDCMAAAAENPTNDPVLLWIDTYTSTQFTVHAGADPGASNLDFVWSCSVQ